jgi:hypothetical protein
VSGAKSICFGLALRFGSVTCNRLKEGADEPDLPCTHSGAAICGDRLRGNRHLNGFVESIVENLGDLADDAKESGSRRVETLSENLRCVCRESAWS